MSTNIQSFLMVRKLYLMLDFLYQKGSLFSRRASQKITSLFIITGSSLAGEKIIAYAITNIVKIFRFDRNPFSINSNFSHNHQLLPFLTISASNTFLTAPAHYDKRCIHHKN